MNNTFRVGTLAFVLSLTAILPLFADETDKEKVTFDFSSLTDQSGRYSGTLKGGASLTTKGDEPVLALGGNNGYFAFDNSVGQFIKTFNDYTISIDVYIPQSTDISGNGNRKSQ